MSKDKIIEWVDNKYGDEPHIDCEKIANTMIEIYENDDSYDNCEELYEAAMEQLEDDGDMYPNGRDFDAE